MKQIFYLISIALMATSYFRTMYYLRRDDA